jgi:hypothetical protein
MNTFNEMQRYSLKFWMLNTNVCMSIYAWRSLSPAANCAAIDSILPLHILQSVVDIFHRLVLTHHELINGILFLMNVTDSSHV